MRSIKAATTATLCIALIACSDGDPSEPQASIEGVYTLVTIDDHSLPFTLFAVGDFYRLEQLSGTMTLNADRTSVEKAVVRETIRNDDTGPTVKDTTVVLNGVWETEQDSVITIITSGDVLFGTVRNGRLTLFYEPESSDSLVKYVYRK